MTHLDNCIQEQKTPLSRLQSLPFVRVVNRFLYSPVYFILIGLMTILANAYAAELQMYICAVGIGLYLSFFGRDYLPLMPLIICCYIAPASINNPGKHEASIFYGSSGAVLLILAALFVVSLVIRLAVDPQIGRKAFFTAKRKLLPGMLVLGAAYLLGGIGSGHYFHHGYNNLLFAAIQFLSIFLLYFIFTGAVRWEDAPKEYIAWTGMCIGFILLAEIALIYLTNPILTDNGVDRLLIYTGWGNYNNVGALLTMMIPFAFYLACIKKHSYIYYFCGTLFLLGVFLTCSRASLLIAALVYCASCVVVGFKAHSRKTGLITNAIVFGIAILIVILFRQKLFTYLESLFTNRLSFLDRMDGYKAGVQQFLSFPVLGGSFFPVNHDLFAWSSVEAFTSFFPPRWHNTVIQLAASCGTVGLLAYAYHRWQTIRLFWKNPTTENLYVALSIAALLLTSLLDCHFFNVGPVLFYSMALAFAENRGCSQTK